MENVYVVSAKRTPIGSFLGSLSPVPATKLGSSAIQAAVSESGLKPEQIGEVIMGHVLTAGTGQAPARQASLGAGLPVGTPCMTINKVCGSGLKAVMLAHDSIKLGHVNAAIAGGQENMSLSPHLMMNSRAGYKMGHVSATDSMLVDGLWDPYNDWHMGNCAELCVKEYSFTREEQDEFAVKSYEKSLAAQKSGAFKNEISSVEVPSRKATITVSEDEEPSKVKFDKIPSLRPAFDKQGSVTAANASTINDGACALTLASESTVKEFGLKPLAKIIGHATHAQDPKWFTTAPVGAMKKVLETNQMKVDDIDLWEVNEAFSVVTMAAQKELKISDDRMNVHGGAVSLGHPIGASGARIFTTLIHSLHTQGKSLGGASICIGGGEAVSVLVEAL